MEQLVSLLDVIIKFCGAIFVVLVTFAFILIIYVCIREYREQHHGK